MSRLRFEAVKSALSRKPINVPNLSTRVTDYFGINVFGDEAMKRYMSYSAYQKVKTCIYKGDKINESLADAVAGAMKAWAIERGATHFTHWFQPLTGSTAEKHDAFFEKQPDGTTIEKFKGGALVQQEPDASSFPHGGIRNTFEARGYTAWDPSSPAFLMEKGSGVTLCIPTIFVSYTGEALDYKTPLLKALQLIDKASTEVCHYFDRDVRKVTATLGTEQEYFVVDKALYHARPDLVLTGRTLFGHAPAKGQQLDDHYFGSIPSRIKAYMQDFEQQALKLGIPVTTRHNEVAPGQYECAPVFEDVNLAVDHNLLLMDVMEMVADKHDLKILFHEKPFALISGNGKHNNWSLATDSGVNLLAPSTRAKENLQFLTFFVNTIRAVCEHEELLRASVASAGNDYRLGANEAPPAIMSVFIGSQLTSVLDELEHNASVKIEKGDNLYMKLGIDKIPDIIKDNTDRNRTSPFAFTGNKFEFRAVGGSANCSPSMTVLNTIVADQLFKFKVKVDAQISKGTKKEVAIVNVLREYIKESKAIRFEGNGYSEEWSMEAAKRGLSNFRDCPRAQLAYGFEKSRKLFIEHGVFSNIELNARNEIMLENYIMKIQIESRALGNFAVNQIIPAAMLYQNKLIDSAKGLKELGLESETEYTISAIRAIAERVNALRQAVQDMVEARKRANKLETKEAAMAYCDEVKGAFFEKIRYQIDKLEIVVPDNDWPFAKYRELLLVR